jgi:polyisoprenoid-binding protein YceI
MPSKTNMLMFALALLLETGRGAMGQSPASFREYRIEAAHSLVGFSVGFLGHPVHGRFDDVRGMIVYVPGNPAASTVTVAIATKSINTGSTHRDEHLRSADFFDAAKYPTIVFTSRRVERVRDTLVATGDLTMHAVTRPVTIPFVAPAAAVADPHGSSLLYFVGHLRLTRTDFGIAGGSRFNDWFDDIRQRAMADSVDVDLEVQAWDTDYDRSARWKGAVDKLLETGVSKRVASLRELVRAHPDTLAGAEWELTEAGRALLQRGRAADAVEVFRFVADLFPASVTAQTALARGYEAMGDRTKAAEQLRRALELDPNDPWAREIARRSRVSVDIPPSPSTIDRT